MRNKKGIKTTDADELGNIVQDISTLLERYLHYTSVVSSQPTTWRQDAVWFVGYVIM